MQVQKVADVGLCMQMVEGTTPHEHWYCQKTILRMPILGPRSGSHILMVVEAWTVEGTTVKTSLKTSSTNRCQH